MALHDILSLSMFAALIVVLLRGFPVAFTLAGVAIVFAALGVALDIFQLTLLRALPSRIYGAVMTNELLVAVPLFIFMGVMLEKSRIAEDLLDTMGALFGPLRGGLGISVIIVGALLAASTGIVGATVVTMGLLALPTMLRRGYPAPLACGTIAASGTLGQIIPPSIVLILLGDQISNAHQSAQRTLGNFAPNPVSVGDLFAGALLPSLLLVGLYILFMIGVAIFRPNDAPAVPRESTTGRAFFLRIMSVLAPPIVLIVAVLGSILTGLATPTEAAAVGAVGATLLAGFRCIGPDGTNGRWGRVAVGLGALALLGVIGLGANFDLRIGRAQVSQQEAILTWLALALCVVAALGAIWALARLLRSGVLGKVCGSTAQISTMVFMILIGATLFSLVFRGFHGDELVEAILHNLPGGAWGAVIAVMLAMFILGFFLDFIEIIFVVVPIVAPALFLLGVDPIWLGVLMAIMLQTSFLTPPFGFALFFLRGVAPPEVTTPQIYWGAAPYIALQIVALTIVALAPGIATWLPSLLNT